MLARKTQGTASGAWNTPERAVRIDCVGLFVARAAASMLVAGVLSCAASSVFQLSGDEQASLHLAMGTPLTFTVPRERSLQTWDRAHAFVDRYASMKLRSVTDSMLVTYDPPTYAQVPAPVEAGSSIRFGYTVSRTSLADGIQIAVTCTASSKLGEKDADQNAHIAAYYIMMGIIACDRCIVR
ncbi:MAG: hypothetical protein E6K76_04985 [Candidatus Eisenbacteria bacterium]|uniref:Uncharacterized protein n=1 Tax=Eiseniibacteriota bacterium TaxID=2212470 RepID=A0A538T6Z2_UNCEI|nr:MAG: hypothetical protein E6K76_04985 [Candidatus Eisenbacteria bacterium]